MVKVTDENWSTSFGEARWSLGFCALALGVKRILSAIFRKCFYPKREGIHATDL